MFTGSAPTPSGRFPNPIGIPIKPVYSRFALNADEGAPSDMEGS